MAKYIQTCLLCKQTYEYCGGCSKYKHLPTFMTTFCSQNCRDIYQVMTNFEGKILTKEEAKRQLMNLDVSRHDYYTKSFATSYNKIMIDDTDEENQLNKDIEENSEPVTDADVSSTIEQIIDNNTISSEEIKKGTNVASNSSNFRKNRKGKKYR